MGKAQIPPRVNEYKMRPEPDGIRVCITCGQEIGPRQVWLKVWAPGSDYAVGQHVTCKDYQMQRRGPQAAKYSECSLCGYASKDAAAIALHFKLIHHIAFGVRLEALVA